MKNYKFNEKQEIMEMMNRGFVDESNYKLTIGQLALYNYRVLGMKKEDNYDNIKDYMMRNAKDFFEAEYQTAIYDEIVSAKKRILRDIKCVNITESELAKISALNDIKKEKIAFVLVAVAKYYDSIKGTTDHYVNMTNSEICKLARVTMRASQRDEFMQFIYDDGVAMRHISPNGTGKKILYVSDDATVISLSEIDFQELAYQYLNWKSDGKGFTHCEVCGRLMKAKANLRYCEECGKQVERELTRLRVQKFREKM